MIKITIYQNKENLYTGFDCIGHAGYADAGEDIICAGVSALVINTINSVTELTTQDVRLDTEQVSGKIVFRLEQPSEHDAALLIQSMILGLQGIRKQYGNEFITLNFKEV